jgi:hypothetical protein
MSSSIAAVLRNEGATKWKAFRNENLFVWWGCQGLGPQALQSWGEYRNPVFPGDRLARELRV